MFEEEAGEFVDGGEFGEVAGMGACCAEDEPEFLSETNLFRAVSRFLLWASSLNEEWGKEGWHVVEFM